MLNKQELINANILVPILKNELEELVSREQGRRVILIDGFPRNLEQQREFERAVSILGSKLAVAFVCVCVFPYILRQQAVRRACARSALQLF
jgi:adenylate kinase family enzyme